MTNPQHQYRDAVIHLYKSGEDNAYEAYLAAGYIKDTTENDLDFVSRCAEQDYDDGAYQGAVYQELYNSMEPAHKVKRNRAHKAYNGHKNYNHWNVSLWINNDEGLYRMAQNFIERYPRMGRAYVAEKMLERLKDEGITHTPDGAPYSVTTIRAAMVGM